MPISLTVLLVIAAVVLLAFGIGSTGGAIRFLSGGAALLIAIAATAATILLFWLGQRSHWTSDGPGALFVMIALVVCAIVAAVAWMFVFAIATRAAAPVDGLPDAPHDLKRVLRLLGFALLAIAAVGQGVTLFLARGRAAHASPVVAVSFATGGSRLVTVDAAGTLVDWNLHAKREERRRTIPELDGVTEFFVASSVEYGFAIANGKALRVASFGRGPSRRFPTRATSRAAAQSSSRGIRPCSSPRIPTGRGPIASSRGPSRSPPSPPTTTWSRSRTASVSRSSTGE